MLVVVPTMTWIGTEPVDDDHDGVPNTLEAGEPVQWPRVMEHGLPADLLEHVAPLLVYLDRAHIRYDLTSDLDLALSRGPRASDRTGVLLAGSERWITRGYARRLRRYVLDGGRLASFGTESLRRGVNLRAQRGRHRRPPHAADAAVGPGSVRHAPAAGAPHRPRRSRSTLIGGEPDYGLLEGLDGPLDGLQRARGERPARRGPRHVAGRARRRDRARGGRRVHAPGRAARPGPPALAATEIGKGLFIRVGLPEWSSRLDDRQVSQVTRNIARPAARPRAEDPLAPAANARPRARSRAGRSRSPAPPSAPTAAGSACARGRRSARSCMAARSPRERVQRAQALALRLARRAVPELGVGVDVHERPRQRVLERVEDDQRARDPRQPHPARLHGRDGVRERLAEPRGARVRQPRRVDGGHARRGQQVLGALAQLEHLERRRQQQQAQRPLLAEQRLDVLRRSGPRPNTPPRRRGRWPPLRQP